MQIGFNKNNFLSKIEADYSTKLNLTGKGIGVAILDTGIFPRKEFTEPTNRIITFVDFINNKVSPYDDCNHGSHVSGILASNKIGVAKNVNIIALKILDSRGNGKIKNVVRCIDWILYNKKKYNIRIANISIGTPAKNVNDENTILVKAVNELWDNGIVVCVAGGNNGPQKRTITTPGISRKIITVGSCDKKIILNKNENIYNYSGRGPTVSCVKKPDVVAPSANIFSCTNSPNGYILKSGTSMATPMVSGAIALLLEKEPYLTPKQVKIKLKNSCIDLGLSWEQQGWGMLNIKNLLS